MEPITVVKDDSISSSQIDSQTTSPGRQQKDEFLRTFFIEFSDGMIPVFTRRRAINSAILVLSQVKIVLQDVHHPCHLAENENSRFFFPHSFQKFVQKNHFPCVVYYVFSVFEWRSYYLLFEYKMKIKIKKIKN